jgi:vitamin-K-epoxide reductase (warfarin-sensitive)
MTFPAGRAVAFGLGWILSAYAVYVEYKVQHKADDEEDFVALCDIKALNASCSQVFALPVGRVLSYFGLVPEHSLFDLPNAALGMIHYTYMLLVALPMGLLSVKASASTSSQPNTVLASLTSFMVASAMASTIFLAYQLTFVLFELCVLCWTTHVINSFVFYRHFFAVDRAKVSTKTKSA